MMQRLIKLYKNVEDNFSSLETEEDLPTFITFN